MLSNVNTVLISAAVLVQLSEGRKVQTVTRPGETEIVVLPDEPADPEPADLSSSAILGDSAQDVQKYDYWGEGECRQRDNTYGLQYMTEFYDLKPWENYVNQGTQSCLDLCSKYSWCFAANVVFRDGWHYPYCILITDRPTFEKVYGSNQDYTWSASKKIDGVQYMTLCGNGADQQCLPNNDVSSHWNGGYLHARKEYYCYVKPTSSLASNNKLNGPKEPKQSPERYGSYPITQDQSGSLVRTVSPMEAFLMKLKVVNDTDKACFVVLTREMSAISTCGDLRQAITYKSPCVSVSISDVDTFESLADMSCNTVGVEFFATMCRDNSFPTSTWWAPECWGLNCDSNSD